MPANLSLWGAYFCVGNVTTLDENKEIVRRYYKEVVEAGHTELLTELIADDVVNHNPLSDESLTAEEARDSKGSAGTSRCSRRRSLTERLVSTT